jgi:phage terminase small subunit
MSSCGPVGLGGHDAVWRVAHQLPRAANSLQIGGSCSPPFLQIEGRMSPLSSDGAKKARQLANLRLGTGAPVGNRRTVRHGAYAAIARERLEEKELEVFDALAQDAPVRAADGDLPAADAVAVHQLCEALVRLDDIADYLQRRGWEDESGKPRPVLEYEGRLRSHVLDLLKELGMTPRARAALGLDLTRMASASDRLDEHLAAHYGADVDGSAAEVNGDVDVDDGDGGR